MKSYRFLAACMVGFGFLFTGIAMFAEAQTSMPSPASTTRDTLQAQIRDKAMQLTQINLQLASTSATLQNTARQRQTLQTQLTTLNNNIKSLNLGIQADTVSAQQLELEIQNLNLDLQDISNSIASKQSGIESVLKEMQKNDVNNGNLFAVFLKKGTLADSFLEANSLGGLQAKLALDITNLKDLHDEYNTKLEDSATKKIQVAAHQANLQNKMTLVQDQTAEKQTLLAATKNQESIYQKQLADLEKQQQQIASDIEALDAVLRTKVDPSTLPPLGAGILGSPIGGATESMITQGYGATSFAKNGYQGHWHNGVDFAAPIGTPILAAEDGTVAGSGNEDLYCPKGAYGKFIAINHNNGLTTLYGHLSRILVSKNDIVKRGQVIGYSGQTGYATGPHLHFTVFAQATFYLGVSKSCGPLPYGGDLNPLGYLF